MALNTSDIINMTPGIPDAYDKESYPYVYASRYLRTHTLVVPEAVRKTCYSISSSPTSDLILKEWAKSERMTRKSLAIALADAYLHTENIYRRSRR